MNATTIQNILAPAIGVVVAYLAKKIPLLNPEDWSVLINAIVMASVTGALGYINRNSALLAQATNTIKSDPAGAARAMTTDAKVALAEATVALAGNSETTKNALLDNVTTLPSVQGIVTDMATAATTSSPLVTSDPSKIKAA